LAQVLNEHFDYAAPKCFFYWGDEEKTHKMSQTLRHKFVPAEKIEAESSSTGIGLLISDGHVGFPIHKFVQLVTNYTDVYYYIMMSENLNTKVCCIFKFSSNSVLGYSHGGDLSTLSCYAPYSETYRHNFMMDRMIRIFESFAATGYEEEILLIIKLIIDFCGCRNPEFNSTEFTWKKHDIVGQSFIALRPNSFESSKLYFDRYNVWEKITSDKIDEKEDDESGGSWITVISLILLLLVLILIYRLSISHIYAYFKRCPNSHVTSRWSNSVKSIFSDFFSPELTHKA
jgi:Carboxylesterase family